VVQLQTSGCKYLVPGYWRGTVADVTVQVFGSWRLAWYSFRRHGASIWFLEIGVVQLQTSWCKYLVPGDWHGTVADVNESNKLYISLLMSIVILLSSTKKQR